MSHYPIFADLCGRLVLLAGVDHITEHKAGSLLQVGAEIHVVADALNPAFQTWLNQGKVTWLSTGFHDFYLDDVFLTVAATDDHKLNRRVYEAAEARGKLCNMVDNAELCSFIVPVVIDRNPIKIAISSGGTPPVLAHKWQQIIKTLVPLHTGKMAQIASRWRNRVKTAIYGTEQRRWFWENLFESRFSILAAQGSHKEAEVELAAQLADYRPSRGEVALVGAGPGDAGLLTVHALQMIQAADVILHNALASDEIMTAVRKDAEKISAGKRAGAHHAQQEEINHLLMYYAREGRRIVWLEGGDPFVFGRGGEEAQVLRQAKIPCRIIPGVIAALGATAYARIPLIHRDCAQSALFVTSHSRHDGGELDWRTLALSRQALVVYMGTLKAVEITAQLIRHGRSEDTPAAIISNGTLPDQTVQTGRLKDLPDIAEKTPCSALMVIGEVAALRDKLTWSGGHQVETAAELAEAV